ncbi:MAG: hypothetical protein EOM50_12195 [Erysipelotrichia bacterium]|nr:hypothetical protein [Erysipelotrichia bacterium]
MTANGIEWEVKHLSKHKDGFDFVLDCKDATITGEYNPYNGDHLMTCEMKEGQITVGFTVEEMKMCIEFIGGLK